MGRKGGKNNPGAPGAAAAGGKDSSGGEPAKAPNSTKQEEQRSGKEGESTESPALTRQPSSPERTGSTGAPGLVRQPSKPEEQRSGKAGDSTESPALTRQPSNPETTVSTGAPGMVRQPSKPESTGAPGLVRQPSKPEEQRSGKAGDSTESPALTRQPSNPERTISTGAPGMVRQPSKPEERRPGKAGESTESPALARQPSGLERTVSTGSPGMVRQPSKPGRTETTETPVIGKQSSQRTDPGTTESPARQPSKSERTETTEAPGIVKQGSQLKRTGTAESLARQSSKPEKNGTTEAPGIVKQGSQPKRTGTTEPPALERQSSKNEKAGTKEDGTAIPSRPASTTTPAADDHAKDEQKLDAGAVSEIKRENTKKSLLPETAEQLSAAIATSIETAMPEEVKEAEKLYEKAENTFVHSKNRAEELLKESKELKGNVEASNEAKQKAEAAVAEAKAAETAVQQALRKEVRAFLDLDDDKKETPAETGKTGVSKSGEGAAAVLGAARASVATEGKAAEATKDAEAVSTGGKLEASKEAGEAKKEEGSAGVAKKKSVELATPSAAAAAAESKVSSKEAKAVVATDGAATKEGAAEVAKGKSGEVAAPPALKVTPAHLLQYSKRQSSDRAAILAALAVVGLDTPETRELVAAAEKEAAETAEKEAAAAAEKAAEDAGKGKQPPLSELTEFHRKTLAKLEGNQQYVVLLQQRLQEEIEELQRKYDRLMEPVFDERAHILCTGGGQEDEEGESKKNGAQVKNDAGEKGSDGDQKAGEGPAYEKRASLIRNEVGTKALPGFWFKAFSNHTLLASLIGKRDKPLFFYLQNIRRVFHLEKADGFSLIFEFGENPFFTPQMLTKTFKMKKEEEGGEWVVDRTEGTPIQWAEGMDVTMRVIMRKQLNMRTKSERTVKEYIQEKSFFQFFKDSVVPTDEDLDKKSEAEQAQLFKQLKTEYDAGVVIRDLIVPYAVNWYLGIAVEEGETISEGEETEAETPPSLRKRTSSKASEAASEKAEETAASSFASWLGF